jgi:nucleotide-binding universal stress UspA family protein
MFKHILIPTDGSPVSTKAVKAGIALAKEYGARVTGFHAVEPLPSHVYGEGYIADKAMIAEFERRSQAAAKKHIATIARAAAKAGVSFDPVVRTAFRPHEVILEEAQKRDCDLILMASHGRRGLDRMMVGSVTDKVIQRSKVPVLVYR